MSRPKILLVDDDLAVRSSIAFALGLEGFDVEVFASAEPLMADDVSHPWSCMVLDHRLPGRDGLALLCDLRASGILCPAIIITSNPTLRLKQQVADALAKLVEKPLLSVSLAETIKSILAGPADAGT